MEEKEITMPVRVLCDGCRNCERLDIRVKTTKLYADGDVVCFANELMCTYLNECKGYAEIVKKAMNIGT